MPKFLHIADVHLGFDRYENKTRTSDFFKALWDVLERYAIGEAVDFVAIAGDLFEHRMIQPAILNQAQLCLQALQKANIPVLAIEGNHDNCPYGTKTSWLRYLSDWGLLKLLEPGNVSAGEPFYGPWDEETKRGGYIDLPCGVRVLGSNWYGAVAPNAITQIAAAIAELPIGPSHSVLLFHHGLEGQIARYSGALRYADLLPLKNAGVDYLALGHIHKHYEMENWIFNPGSIEANNVEESGFKRGALLVELTPAGIVADLKTDYYQRAIVRLRLTTRGQEDLDELHQAAIDKLDEAIAHRVIDPDAQPIVELRIEGQVRFERLDFDTRALQQTLFAQVRCHCC
jgi:DNA repair protein SbcD/Mre11